MRPRPSWSWVIDAYSLAFASLLLPAGALGDRFGRRLALIVGLIVFGAGSAVAMTADSAGELIALRAVLGVGRRARHAGDALDDHRHVPAPSERTKAVSIWAAVAGGAALLGLLISGLAAGGLLVALGVRPQRRVRRRWPWPGRCATCPSRPTPTRRGSISAGRRMRGSGAVRPGVLGDRGARPRLARRADRGRPGPRGRPARGLRRSWELRREAPAARPARSFATGSLSSGSLSIFVQFFAFFGYAFTILQYLQLARGDTPLLAALQVLPMALAMMPISRLAPRLDRPLRDAADVCRRPHPDRGAGSW